MRPRDLCTAAYYDDVQRMKQLVSSFVQNDDGDEGVSEAYGGEHDDEEDDGMEEVVELLRQMDARQRHREKVAKLLQATGTLQSMDTKESCGFMFRVSEDRGSGALQAQFKPSRRSIYTASPLHWAVLGRCHDAVKYLIKCGVDVQQEVPNFPNVTAAVICERNRSLETARVMSQAVAHFVQKTDEREAKREALLNTLEDLKQQRERRVARQKEEEEEAREEKEDEGDDEEGSETVENAGETFDRHGDEDDVLSDDGGPDGSDTGVDGG